MDRGLTESEVMEAHLEAFQSETGTGSVEGENYRLTVSYDGESDRGFSYVLMSEEGYRANVDGIEAGDLAESVLRNAEHVL